MMDAPDQSPTWNNLRAIEKTLVWKDYIEALENEIVRAKGEQQLEMMLAQKNHEETDEYKVATWFASGFIKKPNLELFEANFKEVYDKWRADKIAAYVPKIEKADLDNYFPVLDAEGKPMAKSRSKAYLEAKKKRDETIESIMVQIPTTPQCRLVQKEADE